MKIVKEEDFSIKFEFLGKKYNIRYLETWEIDGKHYEVTYIITNEDSELDKDDKFYEYFSSKKIKNITENILLEFWKNNLLSDKPLILDEVSYPFTMFSFVRIDDYLLSRFSFHIQAYKDLPSLWLNSSTVEYFVKLIDEIVNSSVENAKAFVDNELLIIEFKSENLEANIGEIHRELFKELELICQRAESEILGLQKISSFLDQWNLYKDSNNEKKWQSIIKNHSWIISQLFTSPLIILNDEAYLGGKTIYNRSGNIIDFVYQNKLSNNIDLIEVKTPKTKLIGSKYRSTYKISSELSGAVNQLLNYKQSFLNEFYQISYNSEEKFKAINPKSILIVGKISDLNENKLKAFNLFRNELKSIDIISFDELFEKVQILLKIIKDVS